MPDRPFVPKYELPHIRTAFAAVSCSSFVIFNFTEGALKNYKHMTRVDRLLFTALVAMAFAGLQFTSTAAQGVGQTPQIGCKCQGPTTNSCPARLNFHPQVGLPGTCYSPRSSLGFQTISSFRQL